MTTGASKLFIRRVPFPMAEVFRMPKIWMVTLTETQVPTTAAMRVCRPFS
jgi:hypothetical protein